MIGRQAAGTAGGRVDASRGWRWLRMRRTMLMMAVMVACVHRFPQEAVATAVNRGGRGRRARKDRTSGAASAPCPLLSRP